MTSARCASRAAPGWAPVRVRRVLKAWRLTRPAHPRWCSPTRSVRGCLVCRCTAARSSGPPSLLDLDRAHATRACRGRARSRSACSTCRPSSSAPHLSSAGAPPHYRSGSCPGGPPRAGRGEDARTAARQYLGEDGWRRPRGWCCPGLAAPTAKGSVLGCSADGHRRPAATHRRRDYWPRSSQRLRHRSSARSRMPWRFCRDRPRPAPLRPPEMLPVRR